uniref:Uncharacterized AAA domain-containing protein ycf46 n=1 Tax=viral metagenome TaxID=1070528 RepID=A0A6H1ZAL6_9ZZZZ
MTLRVLKRAGYPFVWVPTTEEDRIIRENRADIDSDVKFFKWDICKGFQAFVNPNGDTKAWMWQVVDEETLDPQAALAFIQTLPEDSIFFMCDYHKYFTDIPVIRQALNIKDHLKSSGKMIAFLSAVTDIPPELRNDIQVVDFPLPDKEAHRRTLEIICQDTKLDIPEDADAIVDAMKGLTQEGAENALAKSLVENGLFNYKNILDQKAAMLKSTGYLTYGNYKESFADLYGLEYMKEWAKTTINSREAKGILIYGVPGTGKSHFAKALANETKRPCLIADFGAIRGQLQGQAEERIRDMLKIIESIGNSTVFCDEIDKSLAGLGGADTDGGVGNRIMQTWMTYMEDRPPGSYWVCTCNSLETILTWSGGALLRRFDCVFFIDMPTQAECAGIARIWGEKKGVEIPGDYDFDGFTGADIKKLATNMSMLKCDVDKARQFMIPTSQAIGDKVAEIRKKARGVCIWASKEQESISVKRRIKV